LFTAILASHPKMLPPWGLVSKVRRLAALRPAKEQKPVAAEP
jgi:hypothetical protein